MTVHLADPSTVAFPCPLTLPSMCVAAFVRDHGIPSTRPKTGEPSCSPPTPKIGTPRSATTTTSSTRSATTTMTVWFDDSGFDYFLDAPRTTTPTTVSTPHGTTTMYFPIDPEERRHAAKFVIDPKLTDEKSTTTSTTERERLLPRRRLLRLLPPRLEDLSLSCVKPEDPLHTWCTKPKPLYISRIFYNMPSILQMSYHHVALHLVGSGDRKSVV